MLFKRSLNSRDFLLLVLVLNELLLKQLKPLFTQLQLN